MSEPNYDNYSLSELQQALASIDEYAFPERAAKIREMITSSDNAKMLPVQKIRTEERSELPKKKIDLERYLSFYTKAAPFLYLISLLFGLSIFINYFIPFGGFSYHISFQLPGLENLNLQENALRIILYSLTNNTDQFAFCGQCSRVVL